VWRRVISDPTHLIITRIHRLLKIGYCKREYYIKIIVTINIIIMHETIEYSLLPGQSDAPNLIMILVAPIWLPIYAIGGICIKSYEFICSKRKELAFNKLKKTLSLSYASWFTDYILFGFTNKNKLYYVVDDDCYRNETISYTISKDWDEYYCGIVVIQMKLDTFINEHEQAKMIILSIMEQSIENENNKIIVYNSSKADKPLTNLENCNVELTNGFYGVMCNAFKIEYKTY
jgi:hypothetical protein